MPVLGEHEGQTKEAEVIELNRKTASFLLYPGQRAHEMGNQLLILSGLCFW